MKAFASRSAATPATAPSGKAIAPADSRPAAEAQRQLKATIAASPRQAAPMQLATPRRNTTGLPDQLKAGVENLSGHSLDDVKVHYNSAKPAQLQALAYAQGTDIHLGPGQEKHLPHEAWHVVQQKQGRVQPTRQLKGMALNNDLALEKEADAMGRTALTGVALIQAGRAPYSTHQLPVIQGRWSLPWLDDMQHDIEQTQATAQHERAVQEAVANQDMFGAVQLVIKWSPLDAEDTLQQLLAVIEEDEKAEATAIHMLTTTYEEAKSYKMEEVMGYLHHIAQALTNPVASNEKDESAMDIDMEMDELTEQFKKLTISFRSDVDNEEHVIYPQQAEEEADQDIIVESNPKPLKLLLLTGAWQGHKFNAAQLIQLGALRKSAKMALYDISGKVKHNITGKRTKANMDKLRKALANIATMLGNLGSAKVLPPPTVLKSPNLGSNSGTAEGIEVEADPLSINSATHGSTPVDGRLMTAIRNLAGPQSKSYVQMHLLNDLVFGPGQLWNLTPGPKQSNVDMESKIEDPLKRAVLGKGLVIYFKATVNYKNDPVSASQKNIDQNPDNYRFNTINFAAQQRDPANPTQATASQDADVKAINGKSISWRYGSLKPLTPKPRILFCTNPADLINVGIPNAMAQRIVNYVVNCPTKQVIKGADKAGQLLAAVSNFDKKKKPAGTLKATSVLWT